MFPEEEDRLIELLRQRSAYEAFRDTPNSDVLQELALILSTLTKRKAKIARGDDPDAED